MGETHDVGLTPREIEVLGRAALGHNNIRIGQELDISVGTVATHCRKAYRKLGVSSRTEAVLKAASLGIIECPGLRPERDGGGGGG